ncbi:hypothetical protein RN629_05075 [Sphingomonadaceae bacterium jetA1]|uniref:hypothetical protein n=1 Tax=Facivitalis istanbulensis TaxID=3075838 RepID=UPI003499D789
MSKVMVGIVGGALMLMAGTAEARSAQVAQSSQIWEQAHVPLANGLEAIAVVRNGQAERTVACRDTADVVAAFRPEVIAFAPAHNARGRAVTDEEVAGVETLTPVAFQNCTVAAGDHFNRDVAKAQATRS